MKIQHVSCGTKKAAPCVVCGQVLMVEHAPPSGMFGRLSEAPDTVKVVEETRKGIRTRYANAHWCCYDRQTGAPRSPLLAAVRLFAAARYGRSPLWTAVAEKDDPELTTLIGAATDARSAIRNVRDAVKAELEASPVA